MGGLQFGTLEGREMGEKRRGKGRGRISFTGYTGKVQHGTVDPGG